MFCGHQNKRYWVRPAETLYINTLFECNAVAIFCLYLTHYMRSKQQRRLEKAALCSCSVCLSTVATFIILFLHLTSRDHNLFTQSWHFNKAVALVLTDLSPLIWPDVPQSCASPWAKHCGTIRHPSTFGLIRQRCDQLIHDGWSPASLIVVMATANQHIAV